MFRILALIRTLLIFRWRLLRVGISVRIGRADHATGSLLARRILRRILRGDVRCTPFSLREDIFDLVDFDAG